MSALAECAEELSLQLERARVLGLDPPDIAAELADLARARRKKETRP